MHKFSSLHHGLPKSFAQDESGYGGGTCTKRPCGVNAILQPVTGSI